MKSSDVIDLSQTHYNGAPSWQTNPDPKYAPMKEAAKDIFNVTVIEQMHMHTAARVDVPLHFIQEGKTIDQFPLSRFMGDGVVLDFRSNRAGQAIAVEEVQEFGEYIQENDIVMLCTDWSKKRESILIFCTNGHFPLWNHASFWLR